MENNILLLNPIQKDYIWGTEKWLFSSLHQELPSVPFLIKEILSRQALSLQVHPDDAFARLMEDSPGKTEMWYILDCPSDAFLYYGLKHRVSLEELTKRIENRTILEICRKVPVRRGEVFYLPAGIIHAIGPGIRLLEIQQNSHITYRIYDYDRKDRDDQPRPLHIEKALQVSHYLPPCFGHEPMGTIEAVGQGVTGLEKNDRVTGLSSPCYSQYTIMKEENCVVIPEAVADEDAMGEALACLINVGAQMALAAPGDPFVVVGCGYMGLGTISLMRAMGAGTIIGVDIREEARENALKYGADVVYSPDTLPEEYFFSKHNFGGHVLGPGRKKEMFSIGFSRVEEFAGTGSALRLAGDITGMAGCLGIGGYHLGGDRNIDFQQWNYKMMKVLNTQIRDDDLATRYCRQALDLIARGQWKFTGTVNPRHIYPLEEFDRCQYELEHKPAGFIKALIRCND